jgi:hypothetical protein
VIRLRSKTWAHDRRAEIPVRYMQRWLAAREKKGGFTLDDLAEIAGLLRDEQVESLMFSAMEAGTRDFNDFVMVSANREILRFWGKLLPLQRQRLRSGESVPVAALFPFQRAALLGMGKRQRQSMFAFAMGSKPVRGPEMLAVAQVSVEQTGAAGTTGAPAPGNPPVARQPAAGAPMPMGAPASLCTIRLSFPNGQKDEYAIPLFRTTGGTAPAPAVPPPTASPMETRPPAPAPKP